MTRSTSRQSVNPSTQRLIAKLTDDLIKVLITEKKITEPSWWASLRGRVWIFVAVLAACLLAACGYQWWLVREGNPAHLPKSTDLAVVLVTAAAVFFAYYQWTDSRRELSLDKFFDRLAIVNERLYEWHEARAVVPHFWGDSVDDEYFRPRMYVYLELDNLEYMIFRYQLGYVRMPLLRRSIRTFSSRCESETFCALAREVVDGAGYAQSTVDVVHLLVADASRTHSTHVA